MGTFRELEEFEERFEAMDVHELAQWQAYWMQHARNLAPRVRKEAMRRVHRIDKAIQNRLAEQSNQS